MSNHQPHFQYFLTSHMEFKKEAHRVQRQLSFYVDRVLISPHSHQGLDAVAMSSECLRVISIKPQCQVTGDQLQVISNQVGQEIHIIDSSAAQKIRH